MSNAEGNGGSLPVISWFDEPIKSSVNSVFGGINAKVEALDLFNKYRDTHFAMLREVVGKVKVLGMSTPLSLVDLYYPTRVSSDIRRRLYKSEWLTNDDAPHKKATADTSFRAIDGGTYVEKCSRLVVLGGPGAGKTTFLKYLALAYTDQSVFKSSKLKTSKLPFFVPLPDLAKSGLSAEEFFSRQLVAREGRYALDFVRRALVKGLGVVMFDSLDEVPDGLRAAAVERVKDFCALYPEVKVIVSCRTADYKEVLEAFDEVELVRLSADAVKKIIGSWFSKEPELADKLVSVIENDSGLASLTETPLLLSLLCIQFRHDLVLPRRKVEIYKRCVEALLRDWDTSRGFRRSTSYESLSDDHKERLFEHVAGRTLIEDQSYVITVPRIHELASEYIVKLGLESREAASVIREIESHHGIIEQHSADSFCFSHASIHDFFFARYALSRRLEREVVKDHLEDESWAGVIEFICGLHAEPEPIFEQMIGKANLTNLKNYPAIERRGKLLFLIYRCLAAGPVLDPTKSRQFHDHIIDSVQGFTKLMAGSGVYAMCAYNQGGVRHPYLLLGHKRPSLHSALLPFRKLSNEILSRPVAGYVDAALERCDEIISREYFGWEECSTYLNVLVPLSRAKPSEVLERLDVLKVKMPYAWLNSIIDESRSTIHSYY